MDRKTTGQLGEQYAARRLEQTGWKIADRNFRCAYGEVDIIAQYEDVLAFIEVKTRKEDCLYHPYEAVTYTKQQHLIHTAQFYLMKHETTASPRFDVIEILLKKEESFLVVGYNHIENAFTL